MVIEVSNLSLQQGAFGLKNVEVRIPANHYGVLMGHSGSGKTSLMEAICGLRPIERGRILLAGLDVTHLRPGERSIGYVPQDGALFPTLSVREQVAFGMRLRKSTDQEIEERVGELSSLLGIDHLLDRLPHGLSGGETQRVAIGRALAIRPQILCLDEPLSALDDVARGELIALLKTLHEEMPVTTLHITHHAREAQELADLRFTISSGQVQLEDGP